MKDEYNQLKKKLNLPDFEKLDSEFEISAVEQKEFLLRSIRRKITEKLVGFTEIFDEILQPEKPSTMYESNFISENERKAIFDIYKKLMYLIRLSEEISIDEDDKKDTDFINKALNDWLLLKENIEEALSKMKEAWTKQLKKEEEAYFG